MREIKKLSVLRFISNAFAFTLLICLFSYSFVNSANNSTSTSNTTSSKNSTKNSTSQSNVTVSNSASVAKPNPATAPHEVMIKNITEKFVCNSNADCSNNGDCDITTRKCSCYLDYSTFIGNYTKIANQTQIDELKLCNYRKKSQLTAFMLCLFVGFGSEHFYLERSDFGIAKLVFYLVCCIGNIIMFIIYIWFPDKHYLIDFLGQYEAIYMTYGFIVAFLWVLYDLIRIGNFTMMDGKNIDMIPW